MKKLNIFSLLLLFAAFFTGCKEETITLTSELPQFEVREGYMLLEVIVPYGTGINDNIYIIGDFNGGESAIGDPTWQLQRGNPETGVPAKFGIYINPNSFMNGKTLADGYYFYDEQKGPELDINGDPIYHYTYPQPGQRMNVFCNYWESDFKDPEVPEEVEHDGYAIFVINHAGYDELALYAWGDAEAFGGWPGMTPTGTQTINGTTYTYFDTGASNANLNLNLIFNNNGNGSQLPDVNVTLNQDFYFELTPDGAVAIEPDQPSVEHDGYAIFVYNNNPDYAELYVWAWPDGGSGDDFLGVGWPGLPFTGTETINGIVYTYYDFGSAHNGQTINVIVNNNNNGKQAEVDGITLDKNYYYELTANNNLVEIDPEDFTPGGGDTGGEEPSPEPEPSTEYSIYIQNETGWSDIYLYSWGGSPNVELLGGWPGTKGEATREIDGVTYYEFTFSGGGQEMNLILNDNDGTQYDVAVVTADADYYFKAESSSASELPYPTFNIYAENKTGWEGFALYSWGSGETFGGWPGALPEKAETINGVEYQVFPFEGNGKEANLIFNNNNNGTQLNDFKVTLDNDMFLIVTSEGVEFSDNGN